VKFIEVFVRRGLVPDAGDAFAAADRGAGAGKEIMFFGEDILAEKALEMGLIHRVFPKEKLMDEAMALASRLAAGPTRSIGMTKKMLNRSFDVDMQTMLEFESAFQGISVTTEDAREGVMSFIEKRPPKFQGK